MIRPVHDADASAIADIYNHYIRDTVISFEETEIDTAQIRARLGKIADAGLPWLVAEDNSKLLGYAYAAPWHARSAYRFAVEVTVYLAADAGGRGLGTALYRALFRELELRGIHTAIGCIALPNPASVALHEKLGMRKIGHFAEVGYKFGQWLDVGYWQIILQPRTP
ncbi:arsinothricin resistance N-acetyltransferase ArsN1 family B [Acidihalobacter ferrooxydans]|uniref:Phosphinothricin acetyltransferase n=1 Tax=Acidihalobacter ferrooxydans TaxID=1765967 RepID=A0A1P8UIA7_9GAMM|nr:arsinothricin resistance N-acetyltransferase ArsN1 family B [Acidihalobacter ferrooxydans]APZ43568.1 phosphinothricin acetyltransferase [Acidihalobacter ferrooxydans]